jgi:uncharacterized protein with HEPN domain
MIWFFVGDMLEFSREAVAKLGGRDRSAYNSNDLLPLALAHLVQTIGEAARRVSDEFRRTHPEIPWTTIVGMRHRIVHDYTHVDFETVWETVAIDLPTLISQLEPIVGEQS